MIATEIAVGEAIDAVLVGGESVSTALAERTAGMIRRNITIELFLGIEQVTDVAELDEMVARSRRPLPASTCRVVDAVNASDLTAVALLAGIERCSVPALLFQVVVGLKDARDRLVTESAFS